MNRCSTQYSKRVQLLKELRVFAPSPDAALARVSQPVLLPAISVREPVLALPPRGPEPVEAPVEPKERSALPFVAAHPLFLATWDLGQVRMPKARDSPTQRLKKD